MMVRVHCEIEEGYRARLAHVCFAAIEHHLQMYMVEHDGYPVDSWGWSRTYEVWPGSVPTMPS